MCGAPAWASRVLAAFPGSRRGEVTRDSADREARPPSIIPEQSAESWTEGRGGNARVDCERSRTKPPGPGRSGYGSRATPWGSVSRPDLEYAADPDPSRRGGPRPDHAY